MILLHCWGCAGTDDSTKAAPSETALAEFTEQREAEAQERYGEHRLKMNVTNEDFFKVHYLKELVPPAVLQVCLCQSAP